MAGNNGVGLDIGTNMLVAATMNEDEKVIYKKQRDAFFKIIPKSKVNRKSILMALENRKTNFIVDKDDFIVVGEDALLMANERNAIARRPMSKGVLSPREKDSLPMIKLIIKSIVGKGDGEANLTFSIPAEPIDGDFDIFFHTEMIKTFLKDVGFVPEAINEGMAVAFSELLDDNLTGVCMSLGAGMVNITVCYEGDPVVQFSLTKGGDWIDQSVGKAIDLTSSMVQIEKEQGDINVLDPKDKIQEAIAVYYDVLINYVLDSMLYELSNHKLPSFREPMPLIVSGGLVLARGFVKKFNESLKGRDFPFAIREVRKAKDPMFCVAHGCLMASIL